MAKERTVSGRPTVLFVTRDPVLRESVRAVGQSRFPHLGVIFSDILQEDSPPTEIRIFPTSYLVVFAGKRKTSFEKFVNIPYGPLEDMELAYLCGCADYLVEPWLPEELFLRSAKRLEKTFVEFPWGRVFYTPFALTAGNRVVAISRQEYELLRLLGRNPNTPVPREIMYRCIGRNETGLSPRLVDVHISSLRRKLRLFGPERGFPGKWNPIRSVRGLGYGFWNMM